MKKGNILLLGAAALIAAKGLDNRLEVTHYKVTSPKIPEDFDNFRISLIADFHCDTTAGLADAIREEHPDIICASGDMTHDDRSYEPFINLLRSLVEIAPVYIVSGNHDVWRHNYKELVTRCRELGAVFLQDERVFVKRGGSEIAISGIEDPFSVTYNGIREHLIGSLSKLQRYDGFDVLMFHRANLMDMIPDGRFDLILAGHMHGGQFRIPGLGGVLCPKTNFHDNTKILFPKYFGGEYSKKNTKMIVTRGIGNPTIIPRLFNRPEICTITLKHE